jgi:serum/glucocorticoid-regulated kinase 2
MHIGSITSVNSVFSPIGSSEQTYPVCVSQLTLDDFDLVKVIGKGGFSKVFQVRKKDTGKIYAMKTLSKAKIKKDNKVENILNERSILQRVQHPFIVRMKYAFQNVIIKS